MLDSSKRVVVLLILNQFRDFCHKWYIHYSEPEEITAILRRLDIDGDQKITYTEFKEGMGPVYPDIIPRKVKGRNYYSVVDDERKSRN